MLQESCPDDHLCCLYCHGRITENALDVHTWLLACPHPVSFVGPVAAFEEDVSYRLSSVAALALVGVGFVDGVEVGPEADLAGAHLCDHGADRAVCSDMGFECRLARPNS